MENSHTTATDNELVEKSIENPDVFGELARRYQNRLFCYIRRISYFCNEDIEDIVQEVFLKAYKGLNSFDGDLKFSTWIYQITRNATIDAIRRKHARPQNASLADDDMEKMFESDIDLKKHIEVKNHLEIMRKIIDELPYKYKEVLILRFLEEKNYDEIMDIVQKPKGTVAALINRGRKMLLDEAREKFSVTQ